MKRFTPHLMFLVGALLFVLGALVIRQSGHCQSYAVQDKKLTPGVVDGTLVADLTKRSHMIDGVEHNICAADFRTPAFRVASKSQSTKLKVCRAYGVMVDCPSLDWELDDIIPIEVGGRNVEANLWPQPIKEARIKDHQVEDLLGGPRGLVCQGKISLSKAQQCIVNDWTKCIKTVAALAGK